MMEFTDLPYVYCSHCNADSCVDDGLREGHQFECPNCGAMLQVELEDVVIRVACKVISPPKPREAPKGTLKLV